MSDENRADLSNDPAGDVELSDTDLESVAGGNTECAGTMGCCQGMTVASANTCCCETWNCTIIRCRPDDNTAVT